MRLKIPGQIGRFYGLVSACQWPRSCYTGPGRKGAAVTNGTPRIDEIRDLAEVKSYLARNPGAKSWEVAMCCNMGDDHARRLIKMARGKA